MLADEPLASNAPDSAISEFWKSFSENKGAVVGLSIIAVVGMLALLADIVSPYSPAEQFREFVKLPPSWEEGGTTQFLLGTDGLGRDMLSRLIQGARVSLFIGLTVTLISISCGIVLGMVAAFRDGIIDTVIMRTMDLLMAVPGLVLAILIVAVLGPSLTNTIVAVTIGCLPRYVRLVRASALGEMNKDYVTAAKVSGVRSVRLMFVTVLPNCLAPVIVQATLGISDAILEAAALGFLGLGAQPPTPEWGSMWADSHEFIRSNPWIVTLPGLAILITVVAINVMGDGLRDALDPKLKRS